MQATMWELVASKFRDFWRKRLTIYCLLGVKNNEYFMIIRKLIATFYLAEKKSIVFSSNCNKNISFWWCISVRSMSRLPDSCLFGNYRLGNVFTGVCHSVHRERGWGLTDTHNLLGRHPPIETPPWADSSPGLTPPWLDTPPTWQTRPPPW